jgi:DNA-binding transcriptional regulator LsrR (DeoR family)
MTLSDTERSRLDDAARAGWLYFIAGNTQDEIARKLHVSRATAQRLVSLSLSERLITFRLEHPIAACMELEARLKDKFELQYCQIVPTDPASSSPVVGAAEAAAAFLEVRLRSPAPLIIALGTGRMMRAAVEQIPSMDRADHQLVSLVGNISPDGSASFFDALALLADLTKARHFPMPLPVFLSSAGEREKLLRIDPVTRVRSLAEKTDLRLVGIGQMDMNAQLHIDGFITRDELFEMMHLGAVGEVTGWVFDAEGNVIEGGSNTRLTSIPIQKSPASLDVGVAIGLAKVPSIRAALKGRLLNGLITNETTAQALLSPA